MISQTISWIQHEKHKKQNLKINKDTFSLLFTRSGPILGDTVFISGSGRFLEKEMVTHSILSCLKISWTEEPVGLQSTGSRRVGLKWETKHTHNSFRSSAAAKSLQSCPTLCDPRDGSPLGSPVLGVLQARTLEWVAISFSNAWKWKVKVKSLSRVRLLATPWTAAYQAPPPMGFSRQEYWSGMLLPSTCL